MKKLILLIIIVYLSTGIAVAQWQKVNGPYGSNINSIVSKDSLLFANSQVGGVYISYNKGISWIPCNGMATNVTSLAVCGNLLLAGIFGMGIYSSADNGNSWFANPTLSTVIVNKITVDNNRVYASTFSGLMISTNGGSSYTHCSSLIGGWIRDVAAKDSLVVAGFYYNTGVYVSTDYGVTWTQRNNGLGNLNLNSLMIKGSVIFALTEGGIYKSSDKGLNWVNCNNGLGTNYILHDIIDCDSAIYASGDGVYKSVNNGNSWVSVSNGINYNLFIYMWQMAVVNTSIFGVSDKFGIFKSDNFGGNWNQVNNGLNCDLVYLESIDSTLLVSTDGNGFYVSNDNGQNWVKKHDNLRCMDKIYCMKVIDTVLYIVPDDMKFYKSSDKGEQFTLVNDVDLLHSNAKFLTSVGNHLYIGTEINGVLYSENGGLTWKRLQSGMADNYISALFSIGSTVYVSTFDSIFRLPDGDTNWISIQNGINDYPINSFASIGNILFVSTDYNLYRSMDNGLNWTTILSGIYAGSSTMKAVGNNFIVCRRLGSVSSTSDFGDHWTDISQGIPPYNCDRVVDITSIGNEIFAATVGNGIWKRPLSEIVGIPGVQKDSLDIFPNPVHDYLYLSDIFPNSTISVYDITGKILISKQASNPGSVYVNNLSAGIYFISIQNKHEIITRKFVKD